SAADNTRLTSVAAGSALFCSTENPTIRYVSSTVQPSNVITHAYHRPNAQKWLNQCIVHNIARHGRHVGSEEVAELLRPRQLGAASERHQKFMHAFELDLVPSVRGYVARPAWIRQIRDGERAETFFQ